MPTVAVELGALHANLLGVREIAAIHAELPILDLGLIILNLGIEDREVCRRSRRGRRLHAELEWRTSSGLTTADARIGLLFASVGRPPTFMPTGLNAVA